MAWLRKRPNRGGGYTYYVRHYRFGKELCESTGTSDKREALKALMRVEEDDERIEQGRAAPRKIKHVALGEFMQTYLRDREGRKAPRTLQTDRAKLKIFAEYMHGRRDLVSSVTTLDVEKFRQERIGKVAPDTVNITLAHLRSAFQWAEDHGYTEKNPFAVKGLMIRRDKKIPRSLSPAEIEALFASVTEPFHRAVLSFVLSTGARRSELARLLWVDVDFSSHVLTFRKTKGKKDRAVPITIELSHLLNSLPRTCERVFPREVSWFTRLFEVYRAKAGIGKHLTLHSLRHTSATELLRSHVSVYTVQKLLGHSSLAVTERYLHAVPDDLLEAAEILSGKAKIIG